MAQAHLYVTFTGSDQRPDAIDPGVWADPRPHFDACRAQAKRLGLMPIFMLPAGYALGVELMNSNLAACIAPQFWTYFEGVTESFGIYGGWPPAANWRTEPNKFDTMGAYKTMPSRERRAWVGMNWRPLQALTKCTTFIADASQNDGAGLTVAENELGVHGAANVLGELPPNLPHPNGTNDRVLDAAAIRLWPKVGWVGKFSTLETRKLIDSPVPTLNNGQRAECRAVVFAEYGVVDGVFTRLPPPDPRRTWTAKSNGWQLDVTNGFTDAEATAIRNPPTPTDAA